MMSLPHLESKGILCGVWAAIWGSAWWTQELHAGHVWVNR